MSWTDTRIALDKEDNGGRWILTSVSEDGSAVLRLRVSVGGHWDWHCFRAEIQIAGQPVRVLGEFDLAPLEIIPSKLQAEWVKPESVVASWDPADEPDFLRLPSYLREDFATMVRQWGMVISVMFPAPAWLTIH